MGLIPYAKPFAGAQEHPRHIYVIYDLSETMIGTMEAGVNMSADDIARLHRYLEVTLFGPWPPTLGINAQSHMQDSLDLFSDQTNPLARTFHFPVKQEKDPVTFFFFGESINPSGSEVFFQHDSFSLEDYISNPAFTPEHLRSVLPAANKTVQEGHFANWSHISLGVTHAYDLWTSEVPPERRSLEPAVMVLVTDGNFEVDIYKNVPGVTRRLFTYRNRLPESILAQLGTQGRREAVSITVSLVNDRQGPGNEILITIGPTPSPGRTLSARLSEPLRMEFDRRSPLEQPDFLIPELYLEADQSGAYLTGYRYYVLTERSERVLYDSTDKVLTDRNLFPVILSNIVSIPHSALEGLLEQALYLKFDLSVRKDNASYNAVTNLARLIPPSAQNHAPEVKPLSVTTESGQTVEIVLLGSDQDGDALSYTIVERPAHGTLTGEGASRLYMPEADFEGDDSFTYQASDGKATSSQCPVTISVTRVNRPPVAEPLSLTTKSGKAIEIELIGSDDDSDSLTYTIVGGPAHGTLSGEGAIRIYTPETDFEGTDSFTYQVSDGEATSELAQLSVTVTGKAIPLGSIAVLLLIVFLVVALLMLWSRRVSFELQAMDDPSIGRRMFELGGDKRLYLGPVDEEDANDMWEQLNAPRYYIRNRFGSCSLFEYNEDEAVYELNQSLKDGDTFTIRTASKTAVEVRFMLAAQEGGEEDLGRKAEE
jgi:hypothetical protein